MKKLIAYCGLVCSECPAYKATQASDAKLAQATADEWSRAYGANVTIDDVWCDGCTLPGKKCAHCGECEVRECAAEKKVENCAYCEDYACQKIGEFFEMAPQAEESLEQIRKRNTSN